MTNLVDRINGIEEKIARLLQLRDALATENLELKKQIKEKQARINDLEQYLKDALKDNRNLKTANTLLGSSDFKRETKLKINSLIKEIDFCITQLSK